MLYIAEIDYTEESTRDFYKMAENVIAEWQEEHKDYYGQPHGHCGTVAGIRAGYSLADVQIPTGASRVIVGKTMSAHLWVTSTGNLHGIVMGDYFSYIIYEGRRHGMRGQMEDLIKLVWGKGTPVVYETQEPDWAPWETADNHEESLR